MKVWINGNFVNAEDATLSVFDAGLQHAVGLFETLAARNGVGFMAHEHMERLAESARILRLANALRIDPLVEAINLTVKENDFDRARVRVTLTGGDLAGLQQTGASDAAGPTIIIVAQPPTPYPDALFERGVKVIFADGRVNPFDAMAGHKTLNYWNRIRTLQDAGARKASEALWLNLNANLASGCVSNVFIVKNGLITTPVARGEEGTDDDPAPVLPGITRRCILRLAREDGLAETRIANVSAEELVEADEVFLTNSSWGVLPVTLVETHSIGNGAVGPITALLRARWLDLNPSAE